jgi:hypothetical protein
MASSAVKTRSSLIVFGGGVGQNLDLLEPKCTHR